MVSDSLQQFIGRIVTDSDFRELFKRDVDQAVQGYDLSDEELHVAREMSGCIVTKTSLSLAAMRYRSFARGGGHHYHAENA